jgi:hypothetical protein
VVSLLYQCLDATAALIVTDLHARVRRRTGASTGRVAAVPRTVRIVTDRRIGAVCGDLPLQRGDTIVLEIGTVGLEFGAGPHACPGRDLAVAIGDATVAEIERTHVVDLSSIEVDADDRPTAMTLRPRVASQPEH